MKKLRVVMLLSLLCTPLMAQAPNAVAVEQMTKLSFLIGQWKGEGWVQYGPGQMSRDGKTWLKFVETKLERVK